MRVVVLSEHDPDDVSAFSGIPSFMTAALSEQCDVVAQITTIPYDLATVVAGGPAATRQLAEIGDDATLRLAEVEADVVICQGSSMIPFLQTPLPIVLWHDSTWRGLLRAPVPEFRFGHPFLYRWDEAVVERCALIAFAAEWVRAETVAHVSCDPTRLVVVPFGANVHPPSSDLVAGSIATRPTESCELTFVGVDWRRKGLPLAHRLSIELRRLGVATTLHVVGPDLSAGSHGNWAGDCGELERLLLLEDEHVVRHGFLRKGDTAEREAYESLLARSHFLVHPAEFECFGVVIPEANAFGVPVLAIDSTGPASTVSTGVNGALFATSDFVRGAADHVVEVWGDPDSYRALATSARTQYEARLSWAAATRQLLDHVTRRVLSRR